MEKNDSYAAEVQAWTQTLADVHNSTRHTIMALICRAVFTPHQPEAKSSLVNSLLPLCGNDPRKLSAMLQTSFMDNRTPIEWVAGSLPDRLVYDANGDPLRTIPGLLSELLEACGDWIRTSGVVVPLYRACAVRSQNALFQLVNARRHSLHSQHLYTVTRIRKSASFAFEIPDFPIRMLSDARIDLRFIYEGVVCATAITSLQAGWRLAFCIIEEGAKSPHSRPFALTPRFEFQVQYATDGSDSRTRYCTLCTMEGLGGDIQSLKKARVSSPIDVLRYNNGFIGANLTLSGKLNFLPPAGAN